MKYINSLLKKVGKGQGGFTLIELLIVIVILGIIAAVVALNVGGFLGTGQLQAANTEASNVKAAVVAYMADNNLFTLPADFPDAGPATAETNPLNPYLEGGVGILKATYSLAVGTAGECMITGAVPVEGGWDATQIHWGTECAWEKGPAESSGGGT